MIPVVGVTTHARLRMAERYGRDLTRDEWGQVVLAIIDRKAVLLRRESADREIYAVALGTSIFRAVWHASEAVILSMLPQRWVPPALEVRDHTMRKANGRCGRRETKRVALGDWA